MILARQLVMPYADESYLEGVMQCPKCKNESPAAAKFCRECGEKLPTTCPKCGNAVTPQDKFCMDCGEKLDGVEPAKTDASIPKLEDMHAQLQNLIPDELAPGPLLFPFDNRG